jgi:outer membrane lipoprotein-sorting protein
MNRLLPVLVLIAVAISGCTEKGPATAGKSIEELKNLSIASAENLSSFATKASVTQILKLYSNNDSNITTLTESAQSVSYVNLSQQKVHASASTKTLAEFAGEVVGNTSIDVDYYLIGNSTYQSDGHGNWTHLVDPRSADEIWGGDSNNQVKAMAETFNLSKTEDLGSESVDGEEAYKIKILTGSEDLANLYMTASSVAASIVQYPYNLPSFNQTELNETAKMEKTIWISKESFLPVKYQSTMSFTMTPEIIATLNMQTGKMEMLNQSIPLGKVAVNTESTINYFDFNSPQEIAPPAEALFAPAILPAASTASSQA